jgi:hypothetical protein
MSKIAQDFGQLQREATVAGDRAGVALGSGIGRGARSGTNAARAELASLHSESHVWGDRIGKAIGYAIAQPIALPLRAVRGTMHELEDSAKKLGGALRSSLSIAEPIGKMAGAAATIGSIGFGLEKGFQHLEAVEEAEARMQALGLSGEQIEETMKRAGDAIRGTAYGIVDVVGAAEKLVTSGIKDEELTRTLTDVRNVASLTGGTIDSTTDLMLKFRSEWKEGGLELRKFAQEGLPQLSDWLQQFKHVGPEALADMFKKGQVTYDDILGAIEAHTGGVAERMSHTIGSQMHLLGVNIGNVFDQLINPSGKGGDAGGRALEHLNNELGKAGSFLQAHGQQIEGIYQNVGHALDNTWHAVTNVWHALENTWHAATNVWHAVTNFWHACENTWHAITNIWHAFENVWHAVSNVGHAVENILHALGIQTTYVDNVKKSWHELEDSVKRVWHGAEDFWHACESAWHMAENIAQAFGHIIEKLPGFSNFLKGLQHIKDFFTGGGGGGSPGGPNPNQPSTWPTWGGFPGSGGAGAYPPNPNQPSTWPTWAGFASGGFDVHKSSAHIQSAVAPSGLVNWAEPSTGGEAYIPLHPSKRSRSMEIWKQTGNILMGGRMFGAGGKSRPWKMDSGGILRMLANINSIDQPWHPGDSDLQNLVPDAHAPSSDWLPQFTKPGVGVPGGPGPGINTSGIQGAIPKWLWEIIMHGGAHGGHLKAPGWWVGSTWGADPDPGRTHGLVPAYDDGGIGNWWGMTPQQMWAGSGETGSGNLASVHSLLGTLTGGTGGKRAPYVMGGFSPSGIDCSGLVSAVVNTYLGSSPFSSRMSTPSEGSWLKQRGLVMGDGPPGTLRIGWYDNGGGEMGHTALTLPDGTNVESTTSHGISGVRVGALAAGASSSQFTNHAYLPLAGAFPGGMGGAGSNSLFGGYGGSGVGFGGAGGNRRSGFSAGFGGAGGGDFSGGTGGGFGGGVDNSTGVDYGPGSGRGRRGGGVDPKKERDLNEKIDKLQHEIDVLEQKKSEFTAKTKESEKQSVENDLNEHKQKLSDAQADLQAMQQQGAGGGMGGSPFGTAYGGTMGIPGVGFPDMGQLGDIVSKGLVESFLPPGFTNPFATDAMRIPSVLLSFFGGLGQKYGGPLGGNTGVALTMGGALLSGKGGNIVKALGGFAQQPYGKIQPGAPNYGQVPDDPLGAINLPGSGGAGGGIPGGDFLKNAGNLMMNGTGGAPGSYTNDFRGSTFGNKDDVQKVVTDHGLAYSRAKGPGASIDIHTSPSGN